MLIVNLSPVRSDQKQPIIEWAAPVLTMNGTSYDLSQLPDGATAKHPVLGAVERTANNYECTMRLPHGPKAPDSTRFPDPIEVTEDGPVKLPDYDEPEVINELDR